MHGGEQWAGSEELQSGLPRSGMWEPAPGRPYTLREWQNKVSAAWSGIWVATCKHHELSLLGKKKKKKVTTSSLYLPQISNGERGRGNV